MNWLRDLITNCWYRVFPGEDPYVPEAAEAPRYDPLAPRIVAGSDLDRQRAIVQAETDAAFAALVAGDLAALDTHLSDFYVLPEGNQ